MKEQGDEVLASIICLTTTKKSLFYVLWSLNKQKVLDKFEIILVVDGIEDEVKKVNRLVEKIKLKNVTIIKNNDSGISNGRNIGAEYAIGELLIFIDDDAFLTKNFIQSHIDFHINNRNYIGIGEKLQFTLSSKNELRYARSLIGIFNQIDDYYERVTEDFYDKSVKIVLQSEKYKIISWFACVGRNMSIVRSMYQKLGGFDCNFIGWGCEDIEFGYRAYSNGVKLRYVPDAVNIHLNHTINSKNLNDLNINLFYFENKYPENIIISLYRLFTFTGLSYEEIMEISKIHEKYEPSYIIFKH